MAFPKAKVGLEAGKLRYRISLQNQQVTHDSDGGQVIEWVEVARLWAGIEPLSAREFLQADAIQSKVTARITIRYRGNVDAKMRIVHPARLPGEVTDADTIYNIHGVIRDNETLIDWITLPVSEGVNTG